VKRMQSAREVGSDFYDFFLLLDGRLGLVIANDPEMMAVTAHCNATRSRDWNAET